ncbi:MAG: DUF3488 and DUF4129 domain-containing transglutaminase family protein [Armatimonadota bacterium]
MRGNGGPSPQGSHLQWLSVYAATGLVIVAPVLAADAAFQPRSLTIKLLVIAGVALAGSYVLRRTAVPRLLVNWLAVVLALGWGALETRATLALLLSGDRLGGIVGFRDVNAMAALVQAFLWIAAFRALTLRTHRDHTLTLIPSISALVLIAVLRPDPSTVVFLCAFLFGGLCLLAFERAAEIGAATRARPQGQRASPVGAPVLPLLASYGGSLAIGILLCALLVQVALPRDLAARARLELAQRIADLIVASTRRVYAAPEASLDLRAGAPRLSSTAIFKVRCSEDLTWRLGAYDVFDGRRWSRSPGPSRLLHRTDTGWVMPPWLSGRGETDAGTREVRQEFMVETSVQGVLVAAYRPVRVGFFARPLRTNKFGALISTATLGPGDRYAIVSAVKPSVPPRSRDPDLPLAARAHYVSLPDDVSPRVLELAKSITAGYEGDFQRARAIEAYLADGYIYDGKLRPTPRGRDPLEYFLFDSKRGYCHHFATATAVLCRAVGIPARLAVGFLPGEADPESDLHVVREADAHSWAEVYMAGAGWMSFDPTGGTAEGRLTAAAAFYQRVADWWESVGERVPLLGPNWGTRLATLLGILALAAVITWALLTLWVHVASWAPRPSATDARGRIVRAYGQACLALARAGLGRAASATPLEFAAVAVPALGEAAGQMAALTDAYLASVYGPRLPDAGAVALAEAQAQAVARRARRLRVRRRGRANASDDQRAARRGDGR